MVPPHQPTLDYYAAVAVERAARFEAAEVQVLHAAVLADCPPDGTALDVGCGSGRDVAYLVANGRDACGVDATPAMLAQARALHPECAARFSADSLPALASLGDATFDLVTCFAVLMHVTAGEVLAALARLRALVAPGGALHIAVPELPEPDEAPLDGTEGGQRLFLHHAPAGIRSALEELGLECSADLADADGLGRRRRRWRALRFRG